MIFEKKEKINTSISNIEKYFKVNLESPNNIYLIPENIISNEYMSILFEKKKVWESKTDSLIFNLIKNEFYKCESLYPMLGNYFIHRFFFIKKDMKLKNQMFFKNNINLFLKSLKANENKNITKILLDNFTKEYSIDLEKNYSDEIIIKKENGYSFNQLKYDHDLYKRKKTITNFIPFLIDGYIEKISEIHHVLEKSAENKQNFVIFCFGMSQEVKHVIKINNNAGKTFVYPVSLEICEENLNILNDIAVLLNRNVLSSNLGQTISQFIKQELENVFCKKIELYNDNVTIYSENSIQNINEHKTFLIKKINKEKVEENKKYLIKRSKRLNSKKAKIYLPKDFLINKTVVKELQYCFSFIGFINKRFNKVNINKQTYYFPEQLIKVVNQKTNSLKSIIERIDLILHNGEEKNEKKEART